LQTISITLEASLPKLPDFLASSQAPFKSLM
jgi:hypothetical protein